jgi:hypothetical protein
MRYLGCYIGGSLLPVELEIVTVTGLTSHRECFWLHHQLLLFLHLNRLLMFNFILWLLVFICNIIRLTILGIVFFLILTLAIVFLLLSLL